MISSINRTLRKSYINYRGWKTNRKLLVIESDDWGSTCLPDKKTYNHLLSKGLPVDQSRYNKFDTLERPEDLTAMFEVLNRYRDKNGDPAVLTAVGLVANPDLERIKEDNFQQYYRKSINDTYREYGYFDQINPLWKEGIKEGFFYPQFHGREHLQPSRLMKAIASSPYEKIAAEHNGVPGVELARVKYRAAFDFYNPQEKKEIEEDLEEGLKEFEAVFGFKSISFCASQGICGDHINPILYQNGVRYHQNGAQRLPKMESDSSGVKNRFWGARSPEGLTYWRRNANFEPSNPGHDWVVSCLWEIENAFKFDKPAVISSHRVNFMGALVEENRTHSLKELDRLLGEITKRWPGVEFIHSETLGNIIGSTNG